MCGIVGYTGKNPAESIIIEGLKRLEYRGYDSAGIASFETKGVTIVRSVGKIKNLEEKLKTANLAGCTAIGHTRWATHGKPSEQNAHPHKAGKITVVHNGIIENYTQLKSQLIKSGAKFNSETDTEVIAHLVNFHLLSTKETKHAILKAVKQIKGSFAVAILNEDEPNKIYLLKQQSPLYIGFGDKENFFASDIPALLPYTNEIVFIGDGDFAEVTPQKVTFSDFNGKPIKREAKTINLSISQAEKGGYAHFMLKEIAEQPEVFVNTTRTRIDPDKCVVNLKEIPDKIINEIKSIKIIACGTSYHSGLIGKVYIEEIADLPVEVEIASEFRYKKNFFDRSTLYIFVSQSGATADTLAALKLCKKHKVKTLSVCNVLGSSISLESDYNIYTHAGPEISVASTKAFCSQLSVFLLLALKWATVKKTVKPSVIKHIFEKMLELPTAMEKVIEQKEKVKEIAKIYCKSPEFLYLGRGINLSLAMEGALKLKEISYIHAEAYAAGEMKHGPIALIDEQLPVFVINTKTPHHEKTLSNIEETLARGGKIIALVSENDKKIEKYTKHIIKIPHLDVYLDPFLSTIPLQLFAYYCAVLKGTDVDQPRNLAKSVTVE